MWVVYIVSLTIIAILHWVYNWRNPRCNGKLPPGSMGWPLLGETLHFFAPYTNHDVSPFVEQRMKRYGSVFRTSLVGRPVVVSADPDLNHFVFKEEGHLFQSWYPDTFEEIFGKQNVGSLHGVMYKYLKNMVLHLYGPTNLQKMLLQERRMVPRKQKIDFFDYVLEELQKEGTILTEPIALDLMFVLLFASYETTSLATTLAMKFLSDHPLVQKDGQLWCVLQQCT